MRQQIPTQARRSPDWGKRFLWAAFLISAVLTITLAFGSCQRDRSSQVPLTTPEQQGQPTATEIEPLEIDQDRQLQVGGNRPGFIELNLDAPVFFLLTGLDLREWEGQTGPSLTDTIIVAALDAERGQASIISLPRDLWVTPPGYGSYKINQVFSLGESTDYPGGGPALLMDTVEQLLGVPIDYYAQVDFRAFIVLVDSVNGVLVDVPEKILVDPDPSVEGDMKRLEPGVQVLPGDLALGYVRTRSTEEGDFGRAKRQQQVLLGLQKKIASYDILPVLIPKLPGLYRQLSSHVETNLTLRQVIRLAWAVRDIDPRLVQNEVIGPPLVEAGFNEVNQYVLFPDVEAIQKIWQDLQVITATPLPIPTPTVSLDQYLVEENARVTVLNATTSPGLAEATARYLEENGIKVTSVGNADKFKQQTQILDYTGKPRTVEAVLDVLELSSSRIFYRADPDPQADIEIILGADWVAENPLP